MAANQSNSDALSGSKPTSKTQTRKKWFIENVVSLGVALLLVFMVRSSLIEAFKIPSGSMIPTLLVGDHIFVNKFAYGVILPFSDWMWLSDSPKYLIHREPPQRGDVVVFRYPKNMSQFYIKRVIGTPGDTVELRSKELYINGQKMERTLAPDQLETVNKLLEGTSYARPTLELFQEKLGEKTPSILLDKASYFGLSENFGPVTVPVGNYFVMGDNRDASNDSRYWGFVPMENIRGKAVVIWLSLQLNFEDKEFAFRPMRTGTLLK